MPQETTHYAVSLHIDKIHPQPGNPEAFGDPVVLARFDEEQQALDLVGLTKNFSVMLGRQIVTAETEDEDMRAAITRYQWQRRNRPHMPALVAMKTNIEAYCRSECPSLRSNLGVPVACPGCPLEDYCPEQLDDYRPED